MMGTNLLIDDPKIVAKGNDMANRMGVDTISIGAMVGFCMECWEKGWITAKDTDGVAYTWGNPDALFSLIEQVSHKRDFGARFAKGTLAAAQAMGPEVADIVVHVKGLDFPAHDARACNSLAPTYATSPRGACHFRGGCEDIEMGGFFIPELGINEGYTRFFERENQGPLASTSMDFFGLLNSLVLCDFMVDGGDLSFSNVCDVFNAITGWNCDITDLMLAAERGTTVMRMINIRDGYDGSTDKLPKKMFISAKEGFRAGKVIPFKELLHDFYEARGWGADGIPSQKTLERLGL
jgi:aldehyde:ferredoxin oxidoreductase